MNNTKPTYTWLLTVVGVIIIPLITWGFRMESKVSRVEYNSTMIESNSVEIESISKDVETIKKENYDYHIEQMEKLHGIEMLIIKATKDNK